MQVKFIDWPSDHDVEEERLALTYHLNSNYYQQLDVLTRARMKMLKKLFTQMNVEVTQLNAIPLHQDLGFTHKS
ncbi:hypothetical protein [Paenibacillus sp. IHBB 10380]|uniref:hypothetical protein n=1 Tax=Paenibacillus sp. IHBB 10380 TaxID=1566358 RepID=UPI0005CFC46B|nr:hypothetical protein [Paenibacillus sp. IHBB 10380]AJS60575.1 hypothetical protein UB51_21355 [Paenibacillus sp. IHBB 10380]